MTDLPTTEDRVKAILNDERVTKLEAISVNIPGTAEAIATQLDNGRADDEIAAELDDEIEKVSFRQAQAKVEHERAEAARVAEEKRAELLATAAIILPGIVGYVTIRQGTEAAASLALDYAEELIAQSHDRTTNLN